MKERILINEQQGISIWYPDRGLIKFCFSNFVFCMTIDEIRDFMRSLYEAVPMEKESKYGYEVSAYLMHTPIPTMQLAFAPNEQKYLLNFCRRSIIMAEQMTLAN